MLAIRLPDEIENRLEELARKTGRTKTYYAREAILAHLEDMEDYYQAAESYQEYMAGKEKTVSLEEVEQDLGLDD